MYFVSMGRPCPIGESAPKQNSAPESAARQFRCIPGQNSGLGADLTFRNRFEGEQKTAPESAPPNFYEFEHFWRINEENLLELDQILTAAQRAESKLDSAR